jgi:hypothetical protein
MDQRARELKKDWKANEREVARSAFPLADEVLAQLFAAVSEAVDRDGCDHTLRVTEEWLAHHHVDVRAVVEWLLANGGFCDCEVVGNVVDHWEQNR